MDSNVEAHILGAVATRHAYLATLSYRETVCLLGLSGAAHNVKSLQSWVM